MRFGGRSTEFGGSATHHDHALGFPSSRALAISAFTVHTPMLQTL